MTTWSLAEDLLLGGFLYHGLHIQTGQLMGMKPHPTTWATCNLAFLLRLAAKERFEDVASYRQTSSEMETSTERMEKVSSPWPLMFLTFGGGSLMGRMLRF